MISEAQRADTQYAEVDKKAARGGVNRTIMRCFVYLVIIAYVTISLLPLISSGFYSDDMIQSTLKGQLEMQNSSVIKHIIDVSMHWIRNNGRFYPVSMFFVFYAAYFFHNVIVYKILLLVMVIINIFVFGLLIENITSNKYISYLSMLLMPLMFQFRLYHDPVLSFYGLMQLFMLLTLCSLLFYSKYLKCNDTKYLFLSILFYNIVLYLYEISLVLIVLYVIMLLSSVRQNKSSIMIKKLLPFILSFLIAVFIIILVRSLKNTSAPGYSGIELGLNAVSIVKSMLLQLYATIPLSYYISNPSHLFQLTTSEFVKNIKLKDVAGLILLVSCYMYVFRNMKVVYDKYNARMMAYIGIVLTICPAFMISLSAKYQKEIRVGVGYIQVYIQYYGAVFIVIALIMYAQYKLNARHKQYALHVFMLMVFSGIFMLNVQNNRLVIEQSNVDMHYRRSALIMSLDENILGNVPENSVIFIKDDYNFVLYPQVQSDIRSWAESGYPWKNEALVYMYAKKKMNIVTELNELKKIAAGSNGSPSRIDNIYLLNIKSYPSSSGNREGFVILSKIENLVPDNDGIVHFQSQPLETRFPKEKG